MIEVPFNVSESNVGILIRLLSICSYYKLSPRVDMKIEKKEVNMESNVIGMKKTEEDSRPQCRPQEDEAGRGYPKGEGCTSKWIADNSPSDSVE